MHEPNGELSVAPDLLPEPSERCGAKPNRSQVSAHSIICNGLQWCPMVSNSAQWLPIDLPVMY